MTHYQWRGGGGHVSDKNRNTQSQHRPDTEADQTNKHALNHLELLNNEYLISFFNESRIYNSEGAEHAEQQRAEQI